MRDLRDIFFPRHFLPLRYLLLGYYNSSFSETTPMYECQSFCRLIHEWNMRTLEDVLQKKKEKEEEAISRGVWRTWLKKRRTFELFGRGVATLDKGITLYTWKHHLPKLQEDTFWLERHMIKKMDAY